MDFPPDQISLGNCSVWRFIHGDGVASENNFVRSFYAVNVNMHVD